MDQSNREIREIRNKIRAYKNARVKYSNSFGEIIPSAYGFLLSPSQFTYAYFFAYFAYFAVLIPKQC